MIKKAAPEKYTVVVAGNYADMSSGKIRAVLTQRLMYVKNRVFPQRMQLLVPVQPDALSALAARTVRALRCEVMPDPRLADPEFRESVDLVILVKVNAHEDTPEEIIDALERKYDAMVDPWGDNENTFEIEVDAGKLTEVPRPTSVYDLKLPDLPEATTLQYDTNKIEQWKAQNVREGEPTHDRDHVPEHGPDTMADGNMAGGQQQS